MLGLVVAALLAGRIAGRRRLDRRGHSRRRRATDRGTCGATTCCSSLLGAVPGAVVLGRLGYGLLHLDYYAGDWRALLDPAQGSLELTLAVVGGTLTGIYVAALLDAPVGRWLHVAIVPLLLVLGLGKAAQALGGSGQGTAADLAWATAYLPPGPWGSPGAEIPAHPAQLYEAATTARRPARRDRPRRGSRRCGGPTAGSTRSASACGPSAAGWSRRRGATRT